MACAECKMLFSSHCHLDGDIKHKGFQFSRTVTSLEQGVEQCYEICQSMLDSSSKFNRDHALIGSKTRDTSTLDLVLHYKYEVNEWLCCNIEGPPIGIIGFILVKYDGADDVKYPTEQSQTSQASRYIPTSTTTFCEETCRVVLEWLDTCDTTHYFCKRKIIGTYPTRLIDLGVSSQSGMVDNIRLCSPTTDHVELPYITLSHSWGKSHIFTLTSTNIEELFHKIPYKKLSNVFKDAIAVTRKLGVRYLWIDSLCIIQSGAGSAEDWDFEAQRMGDVYANAYCNIGASDAMDSSSGLFYPRKPLQLLPTINVTLHKQGQMVETSYMFIPEDYADRTIATFPLLQRAWVYQERMLCARMLHFGKNQIFWECNYAILSERNPTVSCGKGSNSKRRPPREDFDKKHNWLGQIVQHYAGCGLTVDSDIFPALTGVAKEHATRFRPSPDKYLAGLWLEDMPHALAWSIHRDHRLMKTSPSLSRPVQYRAPSWSWASMNRPVVYKGLAMADKSLASCINVTESKLVLKTSNLFGPVEHASLSLLGHLITLSWTSPEMKDSGIAYDLKLLNDIGEIIGSYYPDEFPGSDGSGQITCLVLLEDVRKEFEELHRLRCKGFQGITLEKCCDQDMYLRTGFFEIRIGYDCLDSLVGVSHDKQVITII